jgi:hypothetical protein
MSASADILLYLRSPEKAVKQRSLSKGDIIFGILALDRASKKIRINFTLSGGGGMLRVQAFVQAAVSNIPGVVEITDAVGTSQLVAFRSNAAGKIDVEAAVVPGRYGVQVLTSSTLEAAGAESDVETILMS